MSALFDVLPFVCMALTFYLMRALKIVPDKKRLVVYRFGKIHEVKGPGKHLITPSSESAKLVDLDKEFPGWQSIPERELEQKIRDRFRELKF